MDESKRPRPKPGMKKTPQQLAKLRASVARGERHWNWRGDQASVKTGRTRAERLYPESRPCEKCGKPGAERHHEDGDTLNNDPGNIRFLCRRCHMEEDGRLGRVGKANRGRKHPYRGRFTAADVEEMRLRLESGESQASVAATFKTSQSQVSRLVIGKRRVKS